MRLEIVHVKVAPIRSPSDGVFCTFNGFFFINSTQLLATNLFPNLSVWTRCHLVAAYEDFTCGIVAKQTCGFVRTAVSEEIRCDYTLWCFDLLELPEGFSMAANEVRAANLVLVCTYGTQPIPAEICRWLKTFIGERDEAAIAIVGLFGRVEDNSMSMPAYQNLTDLLQDADVPFYTQTFGVPRFERLGPRNTREPRAHDLLTDNLFPNQFRREWGINE